MIKAHSDKMDQIMEERRLWKIYEEEKCLEYYEKKRKENNM